MRTTLIASAAVVLLLTAAPLFATTDCELRYKLDSWSLLYKEAKGHGVITCDNGQWAPVSIRAKGVGLTVVWSGVVAFIAYKLVDLTIGLRVPEEEEREGLDVTSHGEAAYRM